MKSPKGDITVDDYVFDDEISETDDDSSEKGFYTKSPTEVDLSAFTPRNFLSSSARMIQKEEQWNFTLEKSKLPTMKRPTTTSPLEGHLRSRSRSELNI